MAKRLLGDQMTRIRNSCNTNYTNEAMLPLSMCICFFPLAPDADKGKQRRKKGFMFHKYINYRFCFVQSNTGWCYIIMINGEMTI
jgi:hypothetical protein